MQATVKEERLRKRIAFCFVLWQERPGIQAAEFAALAAQELCNGLGEIEIHLKRFLTLHKTYLTPPYVPHEVYMPL